MRVALPLRPSFRDPVEEPIRAELFGIERLEQHAESLATAQIVTSGPEIGRQLLSRVRDNDRALREANRVIALAVTEEHWITPAAEWLIDNFFVVDEQLREIRDDLPVGFYRELPKLAEGPLKGYPRVYGIAWAFVAHTDSRFDPETLQRFVLAYQRVQPLTIGELWAIAISLRVVMVENLRRLADGIVRRRAARQQADALADSILGLGDQGEQALAAVLPDDASVPLGTAFAVELVLRLRNQDPAVMPALAWLHRRLASEGTTADDIALLEHQRQAGITVTVRNIITSMRLMSALDWTVFFEGVSLVDDLLRSGSDFAAMDFVSRDSYRHAIEALARGSGRTELAVAEAALAQARDAGSGPAAGSGAADERRRDPGFYLVGEGRRPFERVVGFRPRLGLWVHRAFVDAATPGYLGTLLVLTGLILAVPLALSMAAGMRGGWLVALGLLAAVPASDLAVALLNRAVTALVPPVVPPRLEWEAGVPSELRTMVVVPALLSRVAEVEGLVEQLEVHYLANSDGDVRFALLSDWPDAPAQHMAGDDEILAVARDRIAQLNAQHGGAPGGGERFFVYHRRRLWNASEGAWMGWERKRGKLRELNRLLRGATDTTFLPNANGALEVPSGIRYIVTLDADTRLPIGTVHRLVGTMAHPLNRPRLDPATQRVVEGYAVLQPRVTPPLPGRLGSIFQRLSSGASGIDPYAAAVSDVYQDLFGEGSFTGKGIYDLDAFEAALEGRVPENSLLSHDLFEGLFARAGLVTDIELFEAAPAHYLTAAARQHRWARGDWQLLPWILRERMSAIGRWKMMDNLRRNLSMPAAFLTLVIGWIGPRFSPTLWTAFIFVVIAIPALLPVLAGILPRHPGVSKRSHLRAVARDLESAVGQFALILTMMAFQAWLMADAAVRTLSRLYWTHRRMLEWMPMEHAASRAPRDSFGFYRRMSGGVALTMGAAAALAWRHPRAWPVATIILGLWALSPAVARFVSRPGTEQPSIALSPVEARALRLIAFRTWRYFVAFVTPESRGLPPDNFQETPQAVIVQRTSPTNVGMYLLSAVSAHDFGWIGTLDLVDRLETTLRTVGGLEHYRGHLYNWYDIGDGRPLDPRYVSSVDSGNLAGALLTIGQTCRGIIDAGLFGPVALAGIRDAALHLRESARAGEAERKAPVGDQQPLDAALEVITALTAEDPATLGEWVERLAELGSAARTAYQRVRDEAGASSKTPRPDLLAAAEGLRGAVETHVRDLDTLLPWARLRPDESLAPRLDPLRRLVPLARLPSVCDAAASELSTLRTAMRADGDATPARLQGIATLVNCLERSATASSALTARLVEIADEARRMVEAMDFGFLFNSTRMLFSIGYRTSDGSLDPGHYDLLASEARLLSFIAIAKGDVPVKHWFRLGRALTPVGRDSVLLSWSGSMFEYLMPSLIMRSPGGSLLEQTCRLVVRRQITYGGELGVPWGMSESGYSTRDLGMAYQYSSFGVPGLGLRRGLAEDIVIAPYATALAAMFEPVAAVSNLRALAAAGANGHYGFYESLDYTPSRLPAETSRVPVRMYMAHHQGMVIVAIANVLQGGAMRERFHAEPMVRASELLLQERTPRDVPVARPWLRVADTISDVREPVPPHTRHFSSPHGTTPRTQLLSNGRYAVMITAAGSGYSRWRDLAVTRWREDATRDDTGSYIFLRDVASGEGWSAGFQPSGAEPDSYEVSFTEDRAEFVRRDGSIRTRLEVIVSSEDDAEVRRISLTNLGSRTREIELTSYAEIVLAPPAADAAHPAFSNLFVQTESLEALDTLLATRRPRSPEEDRVWLAHVLAVEGQTSGELEWETDRGQFLGRGHGVRRPNAMAFGRSLSNTVGSVLDPIVSLRRRVRLRPGQTVRAAFSTLVAASRSEILDLADKYRDVTTFERVATLAWTQAQVQLHHLGIEPDEAHLFQTLAGSILYADRALRAPADIIARQAGGQEALWAHGISGDVPIVLVQIDEAEDLGIVRQLLRAHEYWRLKRLAVDLVILNDRATSYLQDLQAALEALVRTSHSIPLADEQVARGSVFVLRADRVTAPQRDVLEGVARASLSNRRGTLAQQVTRALRVSAPAITAPRQTPSATRPAPLSKEPAPHPELEFFNGLGGFTPDGREYVIVLRAGQWTPAPWINVIANHTLGFLVSEGGTGCTWSVNSQENLLTAWSNDPVSDPPSEMFYLRDEDSGEIWSPTPRPIRLEASEYVVRHGHGYTRHEHDSHGIALELLQFVPSDDPIKISRLTLKNHSPQSRRLSVTAFLEWVLGATRSVSAPCVVTEIDPASGAMFARNSWRRDFGTRIAFADLGGTQTAWTGDRTEFLGRNGAPERPAALMRRERLSGRVGAALDPCCVLQATIEIPPGGEAAVVFLLGEAETREQARTLIERYRSADLDEHLRLVTAGWRDVLETIQVTTPDRPLDLLLNGWLLYQTLACRLWARAAFYQASGAYGFRDQLQDVMAVAVARPDLAREQLLRAAARQFVEGDVQHWWHEPAGRGVRTRMSDDLLWLPYVAKHYLDTTGDRAILDEPIPFLEGPLLAAGELESYFEPRISGTRASLFEHCARALDRSLAVGAHGLPLIGTGDWNDGMNRVGAAGKGESVWLAWFLQAVLVAWVPIARERGEAARAELWTTHAGALTKAIDLEGWDGKWYRRAFFDDGTPLGSAANDACSIDSIAQSWSVMSGSDNLERARLAMASLDEKLVDRNARLILLLAPPFDNTKLEPGYIKGYVPGIRENGGQYTHAAAWAVIAFTGLGDGDKAMELLSMLNPITHTSTPAAVGRYRVEPYVLAGDVYSEEPHVGRGGWTWYTGSAGWLYRAGLEWVLGIRVRAARLLLAPCVPSHWKGFSVKVRHRSSTYEIVVENPTGSRGGISRLVLDGVELGDLTGIPLADDHRSHRIEVVLGQRENEPDREQSAERRGPQLIEPR